MYANRVLSGLKENGTLKWQGHVDPNQTVTHTVTIKAIEPGKWTISVWAGPSQNPRFDVENVYVTVTETSAKISKELFDDSGMEVLLTTSCTDSSDKALNLFHSQQTPKRKNHFNRFTCTERLNNYSLIINSDYLLISLAITEDLYTTIFRWARGCLEMGYRKPFKEWKEGNISAVSKVILRK